jgi:hypothetical protein
MVDSFVSHNMETVKMMPTPKKVVTVEDLQKRKEYLQRTIAGRKQSIKAAEQKLVTLRAATDREERELQELEAKLNPPAPSEEPVHD